MNDPFATPIIPNGVPGKKDGLSVRGYVGEIRQANAGPSAAGTAGQYFDMNSLVLSPGLWRVDWSVQYANNGASGFTESISGVGTATGNNSQDLVQGSNSFEQYKAAANGNISVMSNILVLVSETQITILNASASGVPSGTARTGATIYQKGWVNDNTGGPATYTSRLTAQCVGT